MLVLSIVIAFIYIVLPITLLLFSNSTNDMVEFIKKAKNKNKKKADVYRLVKEENGKTYIIKEE